MVGETIECPKCGTNSRVTRPGSTTLPDIQAPQSERREQAKHGMFDAILGNASSIDPAHAAPEVDHILVPDEKINLAFKLVRDLIIFTNLRLLLIDKQGITGKKIEFHSIPYKSIIHFSVETAGTLDLDAELKIYVSGNPVPISKQFRKKGANIFEVQKALALKIIG